MRPGHVSWVKRSGPADDEWKATIGRTVGLLATGLRGVRPIHGYMPRRVPTKPSPRPAGAAAPTGGPVEFPGGLEGRRMALGAAAVLVLAHGINSFVGGPSFVASALFWLLGAGIVTAVFLRATRADSDRAIWVL